MTTVTSIIARAKAEGITIEVRGDRLRFDAPDGLPPDLRTELVEHKTELLELLAYEGDNIRSVDLAPPSWSAPACPAWCDDDEISIGVDQVRAILAEHARFYSRG